VKLNRSNMSLRSPQGRPTPGQTFSVLSEEPFHRMIALERKRTERSGNPFVLMLLDAGSCLPSDTTGNVLSKILSALSLASRETDVTGWYKNHSIIGVLFTDISAEERESIVGTMMSRVSETLRNNLSLEKFSQVSMSMHIFPETWDHEGTHGNPTLYPDFVHRNRAQRFGLMVKRGIDIVGSAAALIALSPVFLVVAVLVKLSSEGPILFRQERLGQFGNRSHF
jgi:hypothetical protein